MSQFESLMILLMIGAGMIILSLIARHFDRVGKHIDYFGGADESHV